MTTKLSLHEDVFCQLSSIQQYKQTHNIQRNKLNNHFFNSLGGSFQVGLNVKFSILSKMIMMCNNNDIISVMYALQSL